MEECEREFLMQKEQYKRDMINEPYFPLLNADEKQSLCEEEMARQLEEWISLTTSHPTHDMAQIFSRDTCIATEMNQAEEPILSLSLPVCSFHEETLLYAGLLRSPGKNFWDRMLGPRYHERWKRFYEL